MIEYTIDVCHRFTDLSIEWMKDMPKEYNQLEALIECYKRHNLLIYNKANFLKSQPKLGDFVACNEAGEVMEKPDKFEDWLKDSIRNGYYPLGITCEKFQQAQSRVLWKGWEIKEHPEYGKMLYDGEHYYADGALFNKGDTYDELITSGVELERIQKTNGQSR